MPMPRRRASRRRVPKRLAALALALAVPVAQLPAAAYGSASRSPLRSTEPSCRRQGERHFDVIVYGDEPAGVMTALELSRQLPRLAGMRRPGARKNAFCRGTPAEGCLSRHAELLKREVVALRFGAPTHAEGRETMAHK